MNKTSVPTAKEARHKNKRTPGLQSARELYRPSDRRLSAKLVSTLADRERPNIFANKQKWTLYHYTNKSSHYSTHNMFRLW
jgi:hypothetical protein